MPKLILISGSIGAGKTHYMTQLIAEIKQQGKNIFCVSFADEIKTIVRKYFGFNKNGKRDNEVFLDYKSIEERYNEACDYIMNCYTHTMLIRSLHMEAIEIQKFKKLYRTLIPFDMIKKLEIITPEERKPIIRTLYQLIGTDIAHKLSRYIWVENLLSAIRQSFNKFDYILIDDWRFMTEYYYILEHYPELEIIPYYIDASEEIRAKRKNITVDELKQVESHVSERDSKLLAELVKTYHPDNYIVSEV